MKKLLQVLLLIVLPLIGISQNSKVTTLTVRETTKLVGQTTIGSKIFDASALLTLTATDKGLLIPRLTTAERDAIGSPTNGLMIYNTDAGAFEFFDGSWGAIGGGGGDSSFNVIQFDTARALNNTNIQFSDSVFFQNPVQIDSPFTVNLAQSTFKGIDASIAFSILATDNLDAITFSVANNGIVNISGNSGNYTAISKAFGVVVNNADTERARLGKNGNMELRNSSSVLVHNLNTVTNSQLQNNSVNLGIGANAGSPTARLFVTGTNAVATADALTIQDNVGTNLLLIENAGDVGIGLADPTAQLHINSTNSFGSQFLLQSSNISGTGASIQNTSTGGQKWTIISNGSSNMGGGGHLQFFDGSNTPFFFHKDGMLAIDRAFAGFVPTRLLELKTLLDDDGISLGKSGAFHAFLLTSPIGGYLQLRDEDGTTVIVSLNDDNNTHDFLNTGNTRNFGVGLTTPLAKFHVRDDVASTVAIVQLHNDRNTVASSSILAFSLDNSANAEVIYACVSGDISDNTNGSEKGDLKFKTILAGSLTEKMTLFSTGNLGVDDSLSIGKNHPDNDFRLDVLGHIKSDSTISTPNRGELLGVAVTTFAVETNVMTISGDGGGNTVATITGGKDGMLLTLIFEDGNVTITDDNSHAANSVDLSAAFTGADDTTLQIVYDGTSWYEVSRSTN